ncbi:hypothetical protein DFAR_2810003 [Desulfarculales bacterium]
MLERRLWGHGFVLAYFNKAPTVIWLRWLHCPDCRAVIRLQPRGYCSRLQTLVETIRQSFFNKLARGRWGSGLPRSRQRHWLKGLLRQVSLYLGSSWSDDLLGAFDWLSGRGLTATSRSAQSESPLGAVYPRVSLSWPGPPVYTLAKHPHGGPTWVRTRKNE